MESPRSVLLSEVSQYYSEKLAAYGATSAGVDWNSVEGQMLRFRELCRVIPEGLQGYSLNDLGCGYGALFEYLRERGAPASYLGVDVAPEMVETARTRFQGEHTASFLHGSKPDRVADFGVASGIFNVRLGRSDAEWFGYIEETLEALATTSARGFAFNCLTSYSDKEKQRETLYYADPCRLFDLCKRRYSKHVALYHDYGLYEFTVVVRREP